MVVHANSALTTVMQNDIRQADICSLCDILKHFGKGSTFLLPRNIYDLFFGWFFVEARSKFGRRGAA